MSSFTESVVELDTSLLYWINHTTSGFADYFFWTLSQAWSWAIVLVAIFLLITLRREPRSWYFIIIGIALCFLFADRTSVLCFKNVFMRPRPCHVLEGVRLFGGHCGGQYSFVSSHAANVFSLASFFALTYRKLKYFPYIIFVWATLVAYSRPYLGVHYPLDVFVGALLGILMGSLSYLCVSQLRIFISRKQKCSS